MASQEELDRQKQFNEATEKRLSLERELNDMLARRIGIDGKIVSDQRDIGNSLLDQLKNLKGNVQEKRIIRSITNQINDLTSRSYSLGEQILGNEKERTKVVKDILDIEKKSNLLDLESKRFATEAIRLERESRTASKEKAEELIKESKLHRAISESLKDQAIESQLLRKELQNIVDTSDRISKNFGVKTFGAISDITKKIPGLSRFSEPFQKASEAARETATNNDKANELSKLGSKIKKEDITRLGLQNQLIGKNGQILTGRAAQLKAQNLGLLKTNSTLMAGVKSLGPALTKALGPIGLIMELVEGLFKANTEVVELKKSMALSSVEATSFRLNLANAAAESGNINITTSKLLETFSAVNKQFGFITNFAANTLVTMTKLTKVVGVSSESAGNLAAASEIAGTSFESNYKDVLATSYELQRQSGVQMDLRDILEQTGKVTGTVRANLGANPSQIAAAVTQAKLFGASLEQVANAGKSLLEFESSITSELEAELLLGRDINLERARAAALAGDQVTLAQELQKEAGNFSDFTKMNVIQQEALAKAMGMTSDQLADILFQQEVQGKSAKELRALGKDELAQRLEAQTAAQAFNATMEKLKSIVVDVVGAFAPILDIVSMIAQSIGKIFEVVGPFKGMLAGAAAGTAVAPGIGTAIGFLLGGISDATSAASTADDLEIPAGYGDTVIKKGKNTIALNNSDSFVAGTNLMSQNQNSSPVDNTETKRTNQLLESSVRALEELTKLSARPSVFQIGTDEFYTRTAKYSYQVQ
jgi:hypothetical protein